MSHPTKAANSTSPATASASPDAWPPSPALPRAWVARIFQRFHGRFGNAFAGKFASGSLNSAGQDDGLESAMRVWAEELAGYTGDEIARGVAARYPFPPSLDEFQAKCRVPIDAESAYREAVQQLEARKQARDVWSSKAIYWTATKFGQFDLLESTWSSAKTRWTKLLEETMAIRDLPDIPEARPALPAPGRTMPPPGVVRDRVAGLASALTGKSGSVRLQWARDILDGKVGGYVRGSAGVTATSRAMALRALRNCGEDVSQWVGEAA